MEKDCYSIGEVSDLLNISVQTLRLYEQRGLLIVLKSTGNQRQYTNEDIERIQCIRSAINEYKISIEGIRRIHALIPCWEYIQCSSDERNNCKAYSAHEGGCWNYKPTAGICSKIECRKCEIYKISMQCEMIKKFIQQLVTNL